MKFLINDTEEITFDPCRLYCIADSGRSEADRIAHVEELCNNGIPYPDEIKMEFNPVSAQLLTQEKNIDVIGSKTTGEVEFVIFVAEDKLYVTVGSDHADRVMEAMQSDLSKQICAKPVAKQAWLLEQVLPHWDELVMENKATVAGKTYLYQSDSTTFLMHPQSILDEIRNRDLPLYNGCAYFCGTVLMANSKFQYGDSYDLALKDPVSKKSIEHSYTVTKLKERITYFRVV